MFKSAFNLIELFGFRIRIDPSWFLLAALIIWALTTAYFPENLPNHSNIDYLALSIVAMLGMFISLLIHELSHSLVARLYGIEVKNITLFVFGGLAELEEETETPKSEFWIAIVGPLSSLVLAGLFYLCRQLSIEMQSSAALQELLSYLFLINMVLAVFNIIPAFPLDGGRVLRAVLWQRSGNFVSATRVASAAGQVFAVFLITTGALAVFTNAGFSGLWQILIGFFIFTASRTSYTQVLLSEGLKEKSIENLMSKVILTADVTDTVEMLINNTILRHGVSFVPVTEGNHLLGYIDNNVVQKIDKDNWATSRVGDVYVPSNENNTVAANLELADLIEKMSKTNQRKMLVADQGVLLGVITLSDLIEYVALRNSLQPS